ncbi:MAG TPA: hypothetical protein VGB82_03985 [Alphaproteobacteria bacterium]
MPTQTSPAPDPWTRYNGPEEVLKDPALTNDSKRALLTEWERDLRQLQTATEENMAVDTGPGHHTADGKTADLLQRVSNCRLILETDS